ncbi:spiro-SPASM protein [Thiospirochaeta perfilievii]|uniref:Spiro-SPASM protein n=1 Tax=Thiospirochaeta perfilievii TaxID=252967 RepID=A0A5C1Q873_9SPIO|nr:spiro-SPASM protein [Thiospirochaeta perfilievii]QEN03240.1 spiro-SPASM protein [Thiospirochaeta perfilievii]
MKNIAIINLIDISSYFEEEFNGKTQLQNILDYSSSLPNVEKIVFLLSKPHSDIENGIIKETWNEESLIDVFYTYSNKYDNLFYFYGDCPLLDSQLSKEMFNDHIEFYSEYTFADGYPYGLTPEILDTNIFSALKILTKDSKVDITRESIFNIIKKDINSFELETKISETDLRLLRVSLTSDSKRNFNQLKRIYDLGGVDSKSVIKILQNNPIILMQEPSYITMEITKGQVQDISYLPKRSGGPQDISLENIDTILDKIKKYSDDVTVAFTPESEPTKHKDLLKIVELITNKYSFDLYIETSGIGWSDDLICCLEANSRVHLIILLDALDPTLYRELRGEGQLEAYDFAKKMIQSVGNRVWVQATRMKLNEVDMEPFYRYWQEFTEHIIIQKYSDYNKTLPELKVADLSPLKRFPCWHLKRDLHINTSGDVLLCFNDINNSTPLGSIINGDIDNIIDKKREYYNDHINCEYSEFCRKCDEYYTFNF